MKWIKVSKQKPNMKDGFKCYLLFSKHGMVCFGDQVHTCDEDDSLIWFRNFYNYDISELATHWMDIPEKPYEVD